MSRNKDLILDPPEHLFGTLDPFAPGNATSNTNGEKEPLPERERGQCGMLAILVATEPEAKDPEAHRRERDLHRACRRGADEAAAGRTPLTVRQARACLWRLYQLIAAGKWRTQFAEVFCDADDWLVARLGGTESVARLTIDWPMIAKAKKDATQTEEEKILARLEAEEEIRPEDEPVSGEEVPCSEPVTSASS